jgi:hypothetical protein
MVLDKPMDLGTLDADQDRYHRREVINLTTRRIVNLTTLHFRRLRHHLPQEPKSHHSDPDIAAG